MDRHLVAYLLIGLLVAAAAGLVAFRYHHSRRRTLNRQGKRLRERYEQRMAERDTLP